MDNNYKKLADILVDRNHGLSLRIGRNIKDGCVNISVVMVAEKVTNKTEPDEILKQITVGSNETSVGFKFPAKVMKEGELPLYVTCKSDCYWKSETWGDKLKVYDLHRGSKYPLLDVLTSQNGNKRYVVRNDQGERESYDPNYFEEEL